MNAKELARQKLTQNAFIHTEGGVSCIGFRSGALFLGETNEKMERHGLGIFFFPSFGFIFGEFRNDLAHGFACLKEPSDNQTIGEFRHGVLHGAAIKFRRTSETVRKEKYHLSRLVEAQPKQSGEFSSERHPEVLRINSMFRKLISIVNETATLRVQNTDRGVFFGVSGSGLGLLVSARGETQIGVFDNTRLHGPGRKINPINQKKFSVFRNGVSLNVEKNSLEINEAPRNHWPLDKVPGVCLQETPLFFEPDQAEKRRRQYLAFDFATANYTKTWGQFWLFPLEAPLVFEPDSSERQKSMTTFRRSTENFAKFFGMNTGEIRDKSEKINRQTVFKHTKVTQIMPCNSERVDTNPREFKSVEQKTNGRRCGINGAATVKKHSILAPDRNVFSMSKLSIMTRW